MARAHLGLKFSHGEGFKNGERAPSKSLVADGVFVNGGKVGSSP